MNEAIKIQSIGLELIYKNRAQNQMHSNQRTPLFNHAYSFLDIYEPVESLNDNAFYYFSEPQPGFQKVSLHRKSAKKQLSMFYQRIDTEQRHGIVKEPDNSTIIDFEYFNIRQSLQPEQTVVDRSTIVKDSQWVRKYEPKKFVELLTDERTNRNVLTWLKSWDQIVFNKPVPKKMNTTTPTMFNRNLASANKFGKTGDNSYMQNIFTNPKKIILLAGPPGCGKTTLMRVLANHCKYQIIEINASDDRSANNLISKIEDIAGNDTIRGNKKPALICLDQIDGVAEGEATGIAKILQFIETGKKTKKTEQPKQQKPANKQSKQKNKPNNIQIKKDKPNFNSSKPYKKQPEGHMHLNRPVIFICNDPFARSLKQLRSKAFVVYFSELNPDKIVKRMRQILEKQKVHIQLQVLQKICEICHNDVRSCIGILELVAKQKKVNNKNPKDLINRMKLSFTRDNQTSINQFLMELFTKHSYEQQPVPNANLIKHMETQVLQIYNPGLLMETFLQNLLQNQGIRKIRKLPPLYDDLVFSDVLMKNGFKHQNELQSFHVIPYLGYAFNFGQQQEFRKIEFPSPFFQRLRKLKWNKEIVKKIYQNIPIQLRIFLNRDSILGCYLLSLYLRMQTSSTKEPELIKCVSFMLTYGFTLKKQREKDANPSFPIFNPQIDAILTYGARKPQILITQTIKSLLQQNYQFFKDRKQMLADNQLRDNTTTMVNQLHLNSRRKKTHEAETEIKYRFQEGTGTKTSYNLTLSYFF